MHRWLLPEYIADILPAEARLVEEKRRAVLDLFHASGYDLVSPPLIEYVESLIGHADDDLDLKTFKLVDQLSGRQMGLRADISPQVARLDAHLLNREGVARLCYAGTVVHTLPANLLGSREQLQLGAEIYGHAGVEADLEVIQLMFDSLKLLGIERVNLDVGDMRIFRSLVDHFKLSEDQIDGLFGAYQRKDAAELDVLVSTMAAETGRVFKLLSTLNGGVEVLDLAAASLPPLPSIQQALADLRAVQKAFASSLDELCFDLVELRGAHYHNGLVFAAYAAGWPNALAWGGRYDNVGREFGRARPATGFCFDLRELTGRLALGEPQKAILAPYAPEDVVLQQAIRSLRAQQEIVVVDLPGHAAHQGELNVDRELRSVGGEWQLIPFGSGN